MLIDELLSANRRVAAVKRAQDAYNRRLAFDPTFAKQQAMLDRHARLGDWLDPSTGRRLLELGCGPGRYVGLLAALGFEVVGIDPYSFDTWEELRTVGTVEFMSGVKAENLPFEEGAFDYVCCLGALLYFDNPEAGLAEMARVLKSGGRAVLRSVNKTNQYTKRTGRKIDPASKNLFTLEEMQDLVERSGFRVHRRFQFGYHPGYFPTLYWYWANVRMTPETEEWLSSRLAPDSRAANIFHLERV